jgi:hypothetical protein
MRGGAAPVAVGIIRVGAAPLALMTAAELAYPHVMRWACTAGMLRALHTPLARRGADRPHRRRRHGKSHPSSAASRPLAPACMLCTVTATKSTW